MYIYLSVVKPLQSLNNHKHLLKTPQVLYRGLSIGREAWEGRYTYIVYSITPLYKLYSIFKTLNPKPLNPQTLHPKPLNP